MDKLPVEACATIVPEADSPVKAPEAVLVDGIKMAVKVDDTNDSNCYHNEKSDEEKKEDKLQVKPIAKEDLAELRD